MNKRWLISGIVLGALSGAMAQEYLISAHQPNGIYMLDAAGEISWKETNLPHPQDIDFAPAGAIFSSEKNGARLIGPDHELKWKYTAPATCQNPVAQVLADGRYLVGNEGPGTLLEIDARGRTLTEIPLSPCSKGHHGQFRFCRKTPQGTYLGTLTNEGRVKEYQADGAVVCDFGAFKTPVSAIRLQNGNTLIGSFNKLSEHDQSGAEIWSFCPATDGHLGGKGCHVTGLVEWAAGQRVMALYHTDPAWPDIMVVTTKKEIVHTITLPKINKVAGLKIR